MTQEARGHAREQERTSGLSDADLQALSYFAMGVSSEGSIGGRNVAYELRFAGSINAATKRMSPVANSGYSLGTIQTDLGQHPAVAAELVAAYQAWAAVHAASRPGWRFESNLETAVVRDLSRTGNEMRAASGVDLPVESKARLNAFLGSVDGISYVHGRDVAQIDHLMRTGSPDEQGALAELRGTTMFVQSSAEDQVRLATIIVKLENQAGRRFFPRVLQGIRDGDLTTVDEVKSSLSARPKYIVDGVSHALVGAELFISLRNAHPANPIVGAWQSVMAEPLVNPVVLQSGREDPGNEALGSRQPQQDRELQYAAIKSLFLQPQLSRQFVAALDSGGTYTYGQPAKGGPGFYVSGDDFVLWSSHGDGQSYIDGAWRALSRRDVTRLNNPDGTVSLNIAGEQGVALMLHMDRNAPAAPRESIDVTRPDIQAQGSGSRADLPVLGTIEGVSRRERTLQRGYDIEEAEPQLNRLADRVSLDAACSGMSEVTLLRRSVHHTQGQPLTGGKLIAWQGDPRDPATRWSVTSVEHAAGVDVDEVLRHCNRAVDRPERSPAYASMQQVGPQQGGPAGL